MLSFDAIFNFQTLALILVGVVAGIIVGAIPGFTITMGVALTLPFSFGMEPINGIGLMLGVMVGGSSGGLLPAILLGIPGTPSAMATTFDGYPMAKKGEPGRALSIGLLASVFGSLLAGVILVFLAPTLANLATEFGPWELFSLMFFGVCAIAGLGGDSLLKSLISGFLGIVFALVGIDLLTGTTRFTFGFVELQGGFSFLPVLIGLFAFSQLLGDVKNPPDNAKMAGTSVAYPMLKAVRDMSKSIVNLVRSSLVGTFVGILPGAGGSIANVMSYDVAKKSSKRPAEYGTGIQDGIIASEAANNSSVGGALIPTMAFGIPGDATTAMMLGVLLVHGIQPGPLLMSTQPILSYGVFISFFIATVFMLIVQWRGIRIFLLVNRIPHHHLVPGILLLCVVGSFAINNRLFDVVVLLAFGLIGYWMVVNKFPLAPFILGIILSPMLETNLRQAITTDPNLWLFLTRPISAVLIGLSLISLIYGIYNSVKNSKPDTQDTLTRSRQEGKKLD